MLLTKFAEIKCNKRALNSLLKKIWETVSTDTPTEGMGVADRSTRVLKRMWPWRYRNRYYFLFFYYFRPQAQATSVITDRRRPKLVRNSLASCPRGPIDSTATGTKVWQIFYYYYYYYWCKAARCFRVLVVLLIVVFHASVSWLEMLICRRRPALWASESVVASSMHRRFSSNVLGVYSTPATEYYVGLRWPAPSDFVLL